MEGKREGGAEREIPLRKASLVEILGIDNYGIYMSFFFCLFYIYISLGRGHVFAVVKCGVKSGLLMGL